MLNTSSQQESGNKANTNKGVSLKKESYEYNSQLNNIRQKLNNYINQAEHPGLVTNGYANTRINLEILLNQLRELSADIGTYIDKY